MFTSTVSDVMRESASGRPRSGEKLQGRPSKRGGLGRNGPSDECDSRRL
jgi:hypothetical protein